MRLVSANQNYAVRATRFYGDEIGGLIDGFRALLNHLQKNMTA